MNVCAWVFDLRSLGSRRDSRDRDHADVAQTLAAPPILPVYAAQLAVFENESGYTEYNETTCEIEAFTMAETGLPVTWRTVSSARSWVE